MVLLSLFYSILPRVFLILVVCLLNLEEESILIVENLGLLLIIRLIILYSNTSGNAVSAGLITVTITILHFVKWLCVLVSGVQFYILVDQFRYAFLFGTYMSQVIISFLALFIL